jgi:hypothetical protein
MEKPRRKDRAPILANKEPGSKDTALQEPNNSQGTLHRVSGQTEMQSGLTPKSADLTAQSSSRTIGIGATQSRVKERKIRRYRSFLDLYRQPREVRPSRVEVESFPGKCR